jgi:hypothetical protein
LLITPQWVEAISTAIYAVVSIGAGIYVYSQSNAAHRQADIMEKQITLQQAALRQWVVTNKWIIAEARQGGQENWILLFRFNIENPTKFPMTLNALDLCIKGRTQRHEFGYTVAPNGVVPVDQYATIPSGGEAATYERSEDYAVFIDGRISYTDCLGDEQLHESV